MRHNLTDEYHGVVLRIDFNGNISFRTYKHDMMHGLSVRILPDMVIISLFMEDLFMSMFQFDRRYRETHRDDLGQLLHELNPKDFKVQKVLSIAPID